jgi:hypothetical protein
MRGFVILLACVLGWYLATQIRTMHPGFYFEALGAELAFACVPAVTLGLFSAVGLGWRTEGLLIGLVIAVAVLSAEFWAAAEEYVFVRQHQARASGPIPRVFFSENWLAYDPSTRSLSGSDLVKHHRARVTE